MGTVLNDIDDGLDDEGLPAVRVLPHLDYTGVRRGQQLEVPDGEVYHWVAGGFTALTRYPVPYRLYPNHAGDPLAYALPEPDPRDPSAVAVGVLADAPPAPVPAPAATPVAVPEPAPAAAPPADSAKE